MRTAAWLVRAATDRPYFPVRGYAGPDRAAAGPDLLATAALGAPAAAVAAWQAWQHRNLQAASSGITARWFPLIAWNLRETSLDDASRELLEESARRAWRATERLLAGARPALEALDRAGLATLVLKGAALAFTVYDRPELRPFGDVDVLVEPQAAPDARRILAGAGWRPLRPVTASSFALRHSLGLTNAAGARVDLHWHALAECCGADADRAFWRRAERRRIGDWSTRVLGPPDQLLHVAVHGLRWSRSPSTHWIADAVIILRHAGPTLDWNVLIEEARRRHLTYQMAGALDVIRHVAPGDAPAWAAVRLRAISVSWRERLEYHVKRAPRTRARLLFLFWCVHRRVTTGQSMVRRWTGFVRLVGALAGWDTASPRRP
jgi:Uncharacterised nucleotidyltransferase